MPLRYLSQEVLAPAGSATFNVQTAFNNPAGTCTFFVTDVATGQTGEIALDFGAPIPTAFPVPKPFQVTYIDD
jgi:hypothetical protein